MTYIIDNQMHKRKINELLYLKCFFFTLYKYDYVI